MCPPNMMQAAGNAHPLGQAAQRINGALQGTQDQAQAQQQAQAMGRPPLMPGGMTGGPMQPPAGVVNASESGPVAPRSAPPGAGYINGPR